MSNLQIIHDPNPVYGPCRCDSRFDGCAHGKPCGQPNDGTGRGPWCPDCQPRRLAALTASLENLRRDFGGAR